MDPSFMGRYLNDGFSGGEKKRLEMLQMAVLAPKYAILDETDSGLDVDALKDVGESVAALRASDEGQKAGFLIITHYPRILQHIEADVVHVMIDGRIAKTGGAELAHLRFRSRSAATRIREEHGANALTPSKTVCFRATREPPPASDTPRVGRPPDANGPDAIGRSIFDARRARSCFVRSRRGQRPHRKLERARDRLRSAHRRRGARRTLCARLRQNRRRSDTKSGALDRRPSPASAHSSTFPRTRRATNRSR